MPFLHFWHISKTAPIIFLKLGMKLGLNKAENIARPLFLFVCPFTRKPLIYAKKMPFLAVLRLSEKMPQTIFLKFC